MESDRTIFYIFKYLSFVVGLFFVTCASTQDLKEIHQKAKKAIKRDQFAEAIPLLKTLVASDSANSEILFNLALAMYNTGDYHGCVKYSSQGIVVDSGYAAHYFRRGVCYSQLPDYQSAIRDYTKAIQLDKKSFSYFNRAIARWKSGDTNGGITDFTIALEMDPKDESGFYYRAMCYEEIGDTVKDELMLNSTLDNLEETSWEFDTLQQALKKQNVSEAKRLYITNLIRTYYQM